MTGTLGRRLGGARRAPRRLLVVALAFLGAGACGDSTTMPATEEVTVTGTVTLGGTPQSLLVRLYHLGGPSPAQALADTTSGADGTYVVSAEVAPGLCDALFVSADLRPVGGDVVSGSVLAGCGHHSVDLEG